MTMTAEGPSPSAQPSAAPCCAHGSQGPHQTQVGMAGQQTAIGDSIGLAIKTFEASAASEKLLILLTDGNDTASRMPPDHAADIARQKGVTVYTIGVGDPTRAVRTASISRARRRLLRSRHAEPGLPTALNPS